ncbi:16S rRNA (guanine(966)-N(2))-methyltransferase RsmD [Paenibacillus sp. J2TS4]|uniref:16S rRNA (guanine(966)-N(2))-methyltransferase RsmD n=1 Tax=Paenibacillus sp. J2TS4 TaxID=2807194 RepID=UPI001B2BED3D|nr:16S rRNA (guanine(966)-N(2))-methyltransferase RsmD [Paenibacillus sp. J2TS4]GIP33000.1 methyltransferase [Paenibacillus sp. J2TS4]
MRVISGTARGRPLKAVPGSGTRPTTDKVKEAVFSMIGPYFDGGRALDLFAGTGALGIEALSRGMDQAVFIDLEKKSIDVIRDNLQSAGLAEQAEVYRNEAIRGLKALAKRDIRFDLVLLDPPYKMKRLDDLVRMISDLELLEPQATVLIECDTSHVYEARIGDLFQTRHTVYGDTAIYVYRYESQIPEQDLHTKKE